MASRATPVALVTGATGCLGRHLVDALVEDGVLVRALVRESSRTDELERLGVSVLRGSLVEPADLRGAVEGVDVVYHLGGVVVEDPTDTSAELWEDIRRFNVEGSERLARIAADAGVRRFVFSSSLRIFGFGSQLLWPEDGDRTPADLYARGKELAEEALLQVGRETRLEVVVIRPRFIYGDLDRYVLPKLVQRARKGQTPIVAGDPISDIVYVKDCVQALRLAAERPVAGQAFNITSGECLSLREILVEVAAALGSPLKTRAVPRPLLVGAATAAELAARAARRRPSLSRAHLRWYLNDHHFSIAKARRELGYEPRYRLRDALREIDLEEFLAA